MYGIFHIIKEYVFEIPTCQVEVEGQTVTGSGPNKKLAKRAAAEAMLQQLGYTKPSPQPVKSAIKHTANGEVRHFHFVHLHFKAPRILFYLDGESNIENTFIRNNGIVNCGIEYYQKNKKITIIM